MLKNPTEHVSAELLNQFVVAGLPQSEAVVVLDHVRGCLECRGRVEILEFWLDGTRLSDCEEHYGAALDLKRLLVFERRLELLKRLHTDNLRRWAEAMLKLDTLNKRLQVLQHRSTQKPDERDSPRP